MISSLYFGLNGGDGGDCSFKVSVTVSKGRNEETLSLNLNIKILEIK